MFNKLLFYSIVDKNESVFTVAYKEELNLIRGNTEDLKKAKLSSKKIHI
jgi:hypothetical protein